jgi:hypothetical protein
VSTRQRTPRYFPRMKVRGARGLLPARGWQLLRAWDEAVAALEELVTVVPSFARSEQYRAINRKLVDAEPRLGLAYVSKGKKR